VKNLLLLLLVLPTAALVACATDVPKDAPEDNDPAPAADADPTAWPAMPAIGETPAFTVPAAETFQLANGVPVTLVRAGAVPLVQVQLNLYRGTAEDPAGKAGLASFAADMLNEGTESRSAVELSEALADLATDIGFGAGLEYSYARLDALEGKLDDSLGLLADMVQRASFPKEDVARVREDRRNSLTARRAEASAVGQEVFRKILFGDQYLGRPGAGTLTDLDAIGRADLLAWHGSVWTPGNAGFVVVTRLERGVVEAALNKHFGQWAAAKAEPPVRATFEFPVAEGRRIFWVDKPAATQSYVVLGGVGPKFDRARSSARGLGNFPLGGNFTSRINMNLREDKGYTYGARTSVAQELRGGMFQARASVKATTTAASLTEFLMEIDGALGDRQITPEEHATGVSNRLQGFPGRFETIGSVLGQFASVDGEKLGPDWLRDYPTRVSAVTVEDARAGLSEVVSAANLTVVIVGDWALAGADVEALGVAPITFLDEFGAPAERPAAP